MPIKKLSKYFFSSEMAIATGGCVLLLSACLLNLKNEKPELELSKQDTAINVNNNLLTYMSAGNKRLLTDLIWVQTLIESDIEHYKKKDLNSWLFLRFNSIATLDPKFYENYLYGGQFLAIVKDDLSGADVLYDKGLSFYPNDYQLNYGQGFLNYFEIGNYAKGLKHLELIKGHPKAPSFLISIINKLKVETGVGLEEVYKLVAHDLNTTQDETLKKRLIGDLYSIKAEIDLVCLNNNRGNCSLRDLNGDPYIQRDGQFYSPQLFLRYEIGKKSSVQNAKVSRRINFIK
jgi:hypothetical protein